MDDRKKAQKRSNCIDLGKDVCK